MSRVRRRCVGPRGRGRPRCAACCSCRRLFIVSLLRPRAVFLESLELLVWKPVVFAGIQYLRTRYDEFFRWNVGLTAEEESDLSCERFV